MIFHIAIFCFLEYCVISMIIIQLLLGGFKFVKGNLRGGDMTIVKGQGTHYTLL